jgi:sulfite oxidase
VKYGKRDVFEVKSDEPFNGSPPLEVLCQSSITPNDLFFSRNHGNIPAVDAATYRLTVSGLVDKPLTLTLDDVQRDFEHVEVTATLQCAGNRREELMEVAPIPGELPWGAGAISNAAWGGWRLRDVLMAAEVQPGAKHVAFTGLDTVSRQDRQFGFGGSIPLAKALSNDMVLLADTMNGEPLPQAHGYPLRAIVPGYIGARSVKWLSQISVQEKPSDNYFQQRAYKLYPHDMTADNVDWSKGIMLGPNTVNSVICVPCVGQHLKAGRHTLKGYALGSEDNAVEGIQVSGDGGATWKRAKVVSRNSTRFTWYLWEVELDLPPGEHELVVCAWDTDGYTQPEAVSDLWNFKGYANNAWHRLRVTAE